MIAAVDIDGCISGGGEDEDKNNANNEREGEPFEVGDKHCRVRMGYELLQSDGTCQKYF